jgi:hypothetical protein
MKCVEKRNPNHKIMIVRIADAGVFTLEAVARGKENFARLFLEDNEVKRLSAHYQDVCTKTDLLTAQDPEKQKSEALKCLSKVMRAYCVRCACVSRPFSLLE